MWQYVLFLSTFTATLSESIKDYELVYIIHSSFL